MQRHIIAVFAAGALGAARAITVDRVHVSASENYARSWLQTHAAPQGDELEELKSVNPDAYAIVKALLTKRSLGLLDPKHPSASFSAPPPGEAHDEPSGAAAFAKFAKPGELASSQDVYPDAAAAAPAHHDWMSWKPSNSATDDDAMVANVLGAVAQLKGEVPVKKAPQQDSSSGSALSSDEDAFASEIPSTQAPAAQPEVVAAAPAQDEQPAVEQSTPKASALQGNSYLRGSGLAPEPAAAAYSQADSLSSFSWGDDAPKEEVPAPQPQAHLVQEKQETKKNSNSLTSWLDGDTAPVPAAKAPVKAPDSNPYAMDLA